MQRESTSDDVRSTDIEDSMTASAVTDSLPPMSRSTSLRSGVSRAQSVLVDVSLLEGPYEQLVKRQEFQKELLSHVSGIKQCVTGISEEVKAYKMKKNATHVRGTAALKADAIKTRMADKQKEVRMLITEVKTSLGEISSHLLEEK